MCIAGLIYLHDLLAHFTSASKDSSIKLSAHDRWPLLQQFYVDRKQIKATSSTLTAILVGRDLSLTPIIYGLILEWVV